MRVVGRSPAVGMAGNSSASMPLRCDSNRPQRIRSVSPAWSSRSTLLARAAGRATMSVMSRAGTVIAPSVSILPGHPVGDADLEVGGGQLQAGVLGPEQDVGQDGQRAAGRHGAADDRQAAREVLLHDRELHVGLTPWDSTTGLRPGAGRRGFGRRSQWSVRLGIHSNLLIRHHHHHPVDGVDGRARPGAMSRGGRSRLPRVDDAGPAGGRLRRRRLWTDPAPIGSPRAGAPRRRRPAGIRLVHIGRRFSTGIGGLVHSIGPGSRCDRAGWRAGEPRPAPAAGSGAGWTSRVSRRRSARARRRSRGAARR